MKCIRLLSIFAWKFAKTCSAKEKSKKTPNTQRQKCFDEKKIKITKENTEVNKTSNQRKCTKSDQINLKQIKNFNKYRKKSKRNESYQEKPKILLQIRKKQLNDQSWNWTSPRWRGEPGTKQQKNEWTTEWTIQ